jgi:hypothetical protein
VLSASFSHKHVGNGELVVCEFRSSAGLVFLTENHEFAARTRKHVSYEVERETPESVFVGNHKLVESAFVCSVQNGFKPAALEVDAGCAVGNEVAALVVCGRRDSGVDDLFLFDDFSLSASAHELVHIGCVVEMLPVDSSNGSNLSVISPASEGVGAYAIRASNHRAATYSGSCIQMHPTGFMASYVSMSRSCILLSHG